MLIQQRATVLLVIDGRASVLRYRSAADDHRIAYTPFGFHAPNSRIALCAFDGLAQESLTLGYLLGNGYRHFFPALQRFGSPDDLSPFHEGGINAYVYCSADPNNFSDPDGHVSVPKIIKNMFKYRYSSKKMIKVVSRGGVGVEFGVGSNEIYSIAKTKLPKGQSGHHVEYHTPATPQSLNGYQPRADVAAIPAHHVAPVFLPKNQLVPSVQLTRPQLKSLLKQRGIDIAQEAKIEAKFRKAQLANRKKLRLNNDGITTDIENRDIRESGFDH